MEKRNSQLRGYMESSLNDLFLTIMIFIVQIVMAVVELSGGPDWRGDLLFCFIALFTGTYALYLLTRHSCCRLSLLGGDKTDLI